MRKTIFITFLSLLLSNPVYAQWNLSNTESSVNFVSIKKSNVSEIHHFDSLKGSIEDSGKISVGIDLGSVNTNIPIRDERMKSMLFETTLFPTASLSASINPKKITSMNNGDTFIETVEFNLSLHGVSKKIAADVRVVKLSKNKLLASSVKPIVITADGFKLAGGVEKLREVAKLPSISTSVPVTFNLIFSQSR